jgi:hypothetical protein
MRESQRREMVLSQEINSYSLPPILSFLSLTLIFNMNIFFFILILAARVSFLKKIRE